LGEGGVEIVTRVVLARFTPESDQGGNATERPGVSTTRTRDDMHEFVGQGYENGTPFDLGADENLYEVLMELPTGCNTTRICV